MSDESDGETCRATDYGHDCTRDDGHDGLHDCSCGVRWSMIIQDEEQAS